MTNIALFRKIMIVLLAVATVIVVVMVLKNSMQNGTNVPSDEVIQQESSEDIEQNQQVEIKSMNVLINEKGFTPSKVTINEDISIKFENMSGGDFYFLRTDDMPPMPNILLSNTNAIIEFKEGQYKLVNKNNAAQTLEIVVNK